MNEREYVGVELKMSRYELTAFDTLYITDRVTHTDYALNEYEKDAEQIVELLNGYEDKIDFLLEKLSELIVYMHELGYDVMLENDKGDVIDLTEGFI